MRSRIEEQYERKRKKLNGREGKSKMNIKKGERKGKFHDEQTKCHQIISCYLLYNYTIFVNYT